MGLESINPQNGEVIARYPYMTDKEVEKKVGSSLEAYSVWKNKSVNERSECLQRLGSVLGQGKDEIAALISLEMGKPHKQSEAEVEKCVWLCDYYAENAASVLQPQKVQTDLKDSRIIFRPLGAILSIMPWNFPLWQVLRAQIPSLVAGNVGLLSHAPNVSGVSLLLQELFKDADFPEGVFGSLLISHDQIHRLIGHPHVQGITFTGSERAGKLVSQTASLNLKKCVLELGGSDPYIIFPDADLEVAAEIVVRARMLASGQVCISPKRIIVFQEIYERFLDLCLKEIRKYDLDTPASDEYLLGPLARQDLREELDRQIRASITAGAELIYGGVIPKGEGFYYPATLLSQAKKGMPAYEEELFGPVVTLIQVADLAQAIEVANDSPYGLGAAVFTRNERKAQEIAAHQLEAGTVAINTVVASDPRLPFGGVKNSGYGRECSQYGILEFVNIKTIYTK